MTVLVVGASGATGQQLVAQLLERGQPVKIVVRSTHNLPNEFTNRKNLTVVRGNVLELSNTALTELVSGCDAIASCLRHNLSFSGMFGAPRRLVADTVRHLCDAIKMNRPENPVRFVLMNTVGNSNRDLAEQISFSQRCVIGLLRLLLPPHADNEDAADFLRAEIGQNDDAIEWAAVRPDSLLDASEVSEYAVHPSPIRSAIFDPGSTSRVNVGHFMAELITDDGTWQQWKGKMPVIYNTV